MLTRREITAFGRDGYVVVRAAVPRRVAHACRRSIEARLAERGIDVSDRSTWTEPVVDIPWPNVAAFRNAASATGLTEAYDQLLGPGAWTQHPVIGGIVPVRFPAGDQTAGTAWHIDGTFARDGDFVTTIESPSRGVLCLILLSDIGPEDAPTELKVGSHLDVPPILAPFGARGCSFRHVVEALPPTTLQRPSVFATGRAGDVFVCHPFLIHRASGHHVGDRPRFLAQPGLMSHRPFRLEGGRPRAVERSIRAALAPAATAPSRRAAPSGSGTTRTRRTASTAATTPPARAPRRARAASSRGR